MRSCLMLAFTLVIDAGVGVGVVCATDTAVPPAMRRGNGHCCSPCDVAGAPCDGVVAISLNFAVVITVAIAVSDAVMFYACFYAGY